MKSSILLLAALSQAAAFSTLVGRPNIGSSRSLSNSEEQKCYRPSPLFMGRAAAVRAATKSKTDAKKAKVNALFGKKIIMAVKQGGSPDPNSNRALADVIKQAKSNSVPVDVSGVLMHREIENSSHQMRVSVITENDFLSLFHCFLCFSSFG